MPEYSKTPLLASLRGAFPEPSVQERQYLCTQLISGLENYYVHLPQKRAAYAIDPVQGLKLLRDYTGDDFVRTLLRIISALHDRHTTLKLPEPWTRLVAYVPFILERFFEYGQYKYVLTKQLFGFEQLPVGTEITHWNGMPIERHVRALASGTQGANEGSKMRLGVANLCIRPLSYNLMPQEDWVTLNYIEANGKRGAITTPWRYLQQDMPLTSAGHTSSINSPQALAGLDEMTYMSNYFSTAAITKTDLKMPKLQIELEGQLRFGALPDPVHGKGTEFGYIRLTTFEMPDATQFVKRMADILASLPQDRLLIDIRCNPGGLIPAGQKLIRLLTDKLIISTSPIAFRNTHGTRLLGQYPQFQAWRPSLDIQYATGQVFSQALPVTEYDDVPDYRYPGKIGLVIDGLCYSTSDFFTADFKDNQVGVVIGIDESTGGGGANVWGWNLLSQFLGGYGVGQLPDGYDMNISMRRSLRTGMSAGLPVEDLGVAADITHQITRADVLDENRDLLAAALNALDRVPDRRAAG